MTRKWIRTGDQVVAIAGNEKGQKGKVLSFKGDRVVVEKLNLRKKHVKPKQKMQSGIIQIEGSMHISNVALCDADGSPIKKLRLKMGDRGQKQLVYLSGDKEIVHREVVKKKKK